MPVSADRLTATGASVLSETMPQSSRNLTVWGRCTESVFGTWSLRLEWGDGSRSSGDIRMPILRRAEDLEANSLRTLFLTQALQEMAEPTDGLAYLRVLMRHILGPDIVEAAEKITHPDDLHDLVTCIESRILEGES